MGKEEQAGQATGIPNWLAQGWSPLCPEAKPASVPSQQAKGHGFVQVEEILNSFSEARIWSIKIQADLCL